MSSILNHIEENPKETQRLIGLGYSELQKLIKNLEKLHDEKQAAIESNKTRIINAGGGRKQKLSIQEQIPFNVSLSETYDNFSTFRYSVRS